MTTKDNSCQWSVTDEDDGLWKSSCGGEWVILGGETPKEHGMNFCHNCGKPLVVGRRIEEKDGE